MAQSARWGGVMENQETFSRGAGKMNGLWEMKGEASVKQDIQ
jgi:hypothetical protein